MKKEDSAYYYVPITSMDELTVGQKVYIESWINPKKYNEHVVRGRITVDHTNGIHGEETVEEYMDYKQWFLLSMIRKGMMFRREKKEELELEGGEIVKPPKSKKNKKDVEDGINFAELDNLLFKSTLFQDED